MEFYQTIFGGDIKNTQLADGIEMFKGHEGKYIHGELNINGACIIYFNDVFNGEVNKGNNIQLTLQLESEQELNQIYEALIKDGQVKMELQDTFWKSKYAVVRDKYGLSWALNLPL